MDLDLEKLRYYKSVINEQEREHKIIFTPPKKKEKALFVGVDIGGTNTRVVISEKGAKEYIFEYKFKSSSKETLLSSFKEIEEKVKGAVGGHIKISASVLAVAGPVSKVGDMVNVTNYQGSESEKDLNVEELPESLFPKGKTQFVNDLQGTCYGIVALHTTGELHEFFEYGWSNKKGGEKADLERKNSYLVLATGTGLGTGAILSLYPREFHIVPLEGGHSFLTKLAPSHPDYELEEKLFAFLTANVWKGDFVPESEDICSGRGLASLYNFLSKDISGAPKLDPSEVSQEAVSEDPSFESQITNCCRDALLLHYKYLARVSQNLSIILQTTAGVFWCGDNQVTNGKMVKKNIDILHKEFLHHTKGHWLKDTPLYLQNKSFNFNLRGALYKAEQI